MGHNDMTSLYNSEHEKLDENQLLSLSKEIFSKGVIEIRQDEAGYLEESTKLQAQSHLWFEHRIGRITSKFFSSKQSISRSTTTLSGQIHNGTASFTQLCTSSAVGNNK